MVYMITAISFIGVVVILEARPVYLFFMSKFKGLPLTRIEVAEIAALLSVALALNLIAFLLPMKLGVKKLTRLEV
jgi:hypothetical protein